MALGFNRGHEGLQKAIKKIYPGDPMGSLGPLWDP